MVAGASEARCVDVGTAVRARRGHARRGVECGTRDGASDGETANVGGLNGYAKWPKQKRKLSFFDRRVRV